MHPFEQAVSIVGAVVLAIIVLTIFYRLLGWMSGDRDAKAMSMKLRGILDEKTPATIQMNRGATLTDVRVVGFTNAADFKGAFPYELGGMIILARPDGGRTLIRANQVRMIETGPAPAQGS